MATFIGTTEECFVHFRARRGHIDVLQLLADFSHVTLQTVVGWDTKRRFPGGMPLLRLRVFMALADYAVSELDNLEERTRRLGYALAFDLLDPESAQRRLGYGSQGTKEVFRLTLVGTNFSRSVGEALESLLAGYSSQIDQRYDLWATKVETVIGSTTPKPATVEAPPPQVDPAVARMLDQLAGATSSALLAVGKTPESRDEAIASSGQTLYRLRKLLDDFLERRQ